MRRTATSLIAAALVVAAAACSGGDLASHFRAPTTTTTSLPATSTTTSTTPASAGFTPGSIEWSSCGGSSRLVQCATVAVPLDYADPTGRTIEIAINKLPARKPAERIGVLLTNPGGPGGSGLDFVASGVELGSEVLDRFDVIGFDPRGVGKSTRLDCASDEIDTFRALDSSPDTPDEQSQLDDAAKAVADACESADGEMLHHIGTDDVVRDMDTIRQALGETQINYLGISYGTLLGLRYAQLFGRNARAIVLDGVVDPTQGFEEFLRQQTIAFDKETTRMLDACPDGGENCPPGGAAAAYDEVARRVESAPLPTRNGSSLGPSELAVALLIPTYETSTAALFYKGLKSALDGDGSALLSLANAYYSSVDFALYTAVECTDSPHPVGADAYHRFAAELEQLSPRIGGAIANELLPCAFWSAPVTDITGRVVAPDAPPIVVVGNTDDAATPYQQAVAVASTLAHGHLLTFESAGHGAYGSSKCVRAAEDAYFVDMTVPSDGATCDN